MYVYLTELFRGLVKVVKWFINVVFIQQAEEKVLKKVRRKIKNKVGNPVISNYY